VPSFWLWWRRDCSGRWHFLEGQRVDYSAAFPSQRDPSIVAAHRGGDTDLILRAYWHGHTRTYKPPTLVLWRGPCQLGQLGAADGCGGWKLTAAALAGLAVWAAVKGGWLRT